VRSFALFVGGNTGEVGCAGIVRWSGGEDTLKEMGK